MRDYHLARQLARRADVTYLGFAHDPHQRDIVRSRVGAEGEIDQITVPGRSGYSPLNILKGLTGPAPISVLNYKTQAMQSELARVLASGAWDVVQMEGVHLESYVPLIREAPSRPRLVSDWHNIESELMRRFAENGATPMLKKLYARRTAELLEPLENGLLARCDAHLVCSERERDILLARRPSADIQIVGNGVDFDYYSGGGDALLTGQKLVFVGSMDYHANVDAALYFTREMWPMLRATLPMLEFAIVGSRPAPEIVALSSIPGITVTGTVPDVRPYYRETAAVVVPLRVGSGTRLKVLEAMAAGVPVISTRLGAEGINFTDGQDLILAEDPAGFAGAVLRVLNDEGLRRRLAQGGRDLVRTKYDWGIIGNGLFDFYAR